MRAIGRGTVVLLVGLFLSIAGAAASGLASADPVAADPAAADRVASGPSGAGTEASGPAIEITYLANEGFLVEAGSKKILIDALFDDETIDYCHLHSPETLAKLEKAEAPFDNVDIVLTTHGHRDHFSARLVSKYMAANPGSVFMGPPQAVAKLAEGGPRELKEKYGERIEEVDIRLFESSEFEVGGIRIEAHRIHHSQYMVKDEETGQEYNRHKDVENLAYLIEVGGVRLLHVGDATLPLSREYLESGRFPKGKIDIVFLEYFDFSDETKEILESMLPDHIIFMHLPPQPEKIEDLTAHLTGRFPNAVLFRKPLETRSF